MEPPIKPDESDCCNSGCISCILDIYKEQLRKYQKTLKVFKLINIEKHTQDCNLYTFEYVRPQKPQNISETQNNVSVVYEPGQHLFLKADFDGEMAQKAYTLLYVENLPENQFTVLVKLYKNGRMSRYFRRLTIGSETLWRGPYGDFKLSCEEKNVLFIAQGTGIAPFYTIICDILNNEECYTFLRLFFCCHSENVLLREELYRLAQFWNFKYELFVSGSSSDNFEIKYNEIVHFSRLSSSNIEFFLKEAKGGAKGLVCGAESFCDNVKNMLVQSGVDNDDITLF